MKSYYCKRCKFTGTRQMVRKHLREDHNIKGKGIDPTTMKRPSPSKLTRATGVIEDG